MHPDEILPVELYFHIISLLDVQDVFALRRTCTHFFALTQDRGLWLSMFARLRATQALPCSITEFAAMPSTQAERVLYAASKVEASFLVHRDRVTHRMPAVKQPCASMTASTCSWRVLTFISDRFLLSVDNTAVVIWDTSALTSTQASSPAVVSSPWEHFTLTNLIGWADCSSTLCLAVSRARGDQQTAVVYSVPLPPLGASDDDHERLHKEAEFPLRDAESLKHMDPHTGCALLYSPPATIHVLRWRDDNKRSTIPIYVDEPDEGWNGITSLRFCGPYILCFRVRSVEAYPIPTDTPASDALPILRHRFGPVCFRAVSLSHVRASRCPAGEVYTVSMLTNDVYQGMFHYRIRVTTAPIPSISVDMLAKGGIRPPDPLPMMPGTDVRYTMEDILRRMFVSTWSVGSAGLRGVWVDRKRGSIDRRVVAFTTHPSRLRGGGDSGDVLDKSDEAPPMDGRVVHVISSYDLRDDITICAVSEWTGRIALGSRVGAISIL